MRIEIKIHFCESIFLWDEFLAVKINFGPTLIQYCKHYGKIVAEIVRGILDIVISELDIRLEI